MSEVKQKYLKDENGEIFSPIVSFDSVYNFSKLLGNGTDLNNIKEVGMYYCAGDADSETILNCPEHFAFSLLVEKHNGCKQTLTNYARIYVRNYINDTWGEWYEIYTNNCFSTNTIQWISSPGWYKIAYQSQDNGALPSFAGLITLISNYNYNPSQTNIFAFHSVANETKFKEISSLVSNNHPIDYVRFIKDNDEDKHYLEIHYISSLGNNIIVGFADSLTFKRCKKFIKREDSESNITIISQLSLSNNF